MSTSTMTKYMIINADDFGYCPKRDKAIVELFQQKSISSTSLLVNGDNAYQACLYAKQYDIPMGIHLNLTEGRPVTNDLIEIKSLVNSNGMMHGKLGIRYELDKGSIQQEHVEYEIINQFNRYKELTNGQLPKHIDGHQHIHVHPMIVESVARLAKQFGINYIRVPYDQMVITWNTNNLFHNEIVNQTKEAMKIFNKYALLYCDYFFGMTTMGKEFTLNNIEKCLKILENESKKNLLIELMCHPGYPSDPLVGGCGIGQPDAFSQSIERQHEFDILSS
ncbi:unnamed protein product [Rotaria socialis]